MQGRPLVRARNRHQTRVLVDCLVDWPSCASPARWVRDIEPRLVFPCYNKISRIVEALCALWATLTSDLIVRALSRPAGFAAGAFKGMCAVTGAARHLLTAFGTARIGQLRSVMSSFEGF